MLKGRGAGTNWRSWRCLCLLTTLLPPCWRPLPLWTTWRPFLPTLTTCDSAGRLGKDLSAQVIWARLARTRLATNTYKNHTFNMHSKNI